MKTLKDAVLKQLRCDNKEEIENTLSDVSNHGAGGGFNGFIYYTETSKFYDENEEIIWQALEQDVEDFGHKNVLEMISTFNTDVTDISTFKNLLAWYALEKVASDFQCEKELEKEAV